MQSRACKECGSPWHTAWFHKKRKAMNWQSPKTKSKEEAAKEAWFAANPPDQYGQYICYLQIAPNCPKYLNIQTVVQEHVISKTHAPELKYDISNRRPSCEACNALKAGQWLEDTSWRPF